MNEAVTWQWSKAPITRKRIAKVEEQWGIRFPEDYIECALLHHGGHPSADVLDVPGRPGAVFNHLLSYVDAHSENENPGISQTYSLLKARLPKGVYPFAADPFGNYLCFDYRDKAKSGPSIVFWDHEFSRNREKAFTYVCGTFTELVRMLYSDDA